jgi:hypothetical protein
MLKSTNGPNENNTTYAKWVIGRIGSNGNDQNTSYDIIYYPVDTSNGGWKLGEGTRIGNGTWCDIHVN